jgi:hypothetical protein
MCQKTEIHIPVLPHLMNYVRDELRRANEHLIFDANSAFGGFVMSLVESSAKKPTHPVDDNYISFKIPVRDERGRAYDGRASFLTVSESNTRRFNDLLDYLMRKELFTRLDLVRERGEAQRKGGKMKVEIEQFIQKYNYPEAELTYERLKKAYYRYRKSGEMLMERVI